MASFPLVHISFAVADETTRLAWDALVRDVFAPETLYEVLTTPESERLKLDRHHTLFAIGDTVVYGSAPASAGLSEESAIGNMLRTLAGAGAWIGIAIGAADLEAAREWVRERGWTPVSYPLLEHRYFLVDRAETLGMRLEFFAGELNNDPRRRPDWDPAWWRDHHPLGLEGLQSIGVSTTSLDLAREIFGEKLGWREIASRTTADARSASFLIGDAIVEAMEPLDEGGDLARHARQKNGIWCLTFQVRSAAKAADYLRGKGLNLIGTTQNRFAIAPEQVAGRQMWFTDEKPAGYPDIPIPSLIGSEPLLG